MTTDVIGLERLRKNDNYNIETINLLSCQDVIEDDFLATIFVLFCATGYF